MAWIVDTYKQLVPSLNSEGCVTGKPLELGGIRGRREATGRGVCYGVEEACKNAEDMKEIGLSKGIDGKTVIVQGFGNVGFFAAKFLMESGALIVGVAELEGAVYNAKGLDVDRLLTHRRDTGSILHFPGAENIQESSKVMEMECDILVPAALENQITAENAGRIKARIIAEAANGPTTQEGHDIIKKRGALIIPDNYLNAGGVTVSYFEWLKNISHVRFGRMDKRFEENTMIKLLEAIGQITDRKFTEQQLAELSRGAGELDLVNSGLQDTMIEAYNQINEIRKQHKIDLRTAAFVSAINKVGIIYERMGIFP
jgi:glutamate dehydrogenase (NAD(P)+)